MSQTFADKLLRASKRLLRYVVLYSMGGVAIEGRVFRIPSTSVDMGFIDACAAFLTPRMALSQVLPSGSSLRRVAIQTKDQLALPERPSASTFKEEENIADASALQIDLMTPAFQPLRGETGRAWFAIEYGITADTSSLISSTSGTERDDTDEEILSFDLGPEPFDPTCQSRLSSDDWLDDLQQGLVPGGSKPRTMDYNAKYLAMPMKPSLLDTMRKDIEDTDEKWEPPPASPERASTPTVGFSYDYATDEPPAIQRVKEAPMHSSPYPEPPKLRVRPGPVLLPPRPRSTSVPPTPTTVQKMAKRYMPITENVTPPISPAARASAMDPETPPPTQRPGRSRGRGKWRAPPSATPGVGTRSQTRQAELDAAEATQAQASRALWPEQPDHSLQIKHMTRDLHLRDPPEDSFREIQRTLPRTK